MAKGKIKVNTENIFPIIKKFLYSDHEIFLRELISNAVDATQKLKTLTSLGEAKGEIGDTTIEVVLDKKKKTLTIKDKGIGMSAEEVKKYINQIAFSGAEEFVNKYKDKTDANIIGHFGLGFYSSFMVSDMVEIISKSYQEKEPAIHWECDGSPEYSLKEDVKKAERGTDIILHISKESEEFLEEQRIKTLLDKYCKFMPVAIKFGTREETIKEGEGDKAKDKKVTVDNIINNPDPAWTKAPASLKEEDYKKFYRELYPFSFEEPLFNIHLNVDYPFNLTGILYFPRLKKTPEFQKNKIQLYCKQVFVTDSLEGIVPEFLTLLHGVIDSPDIPLNVSRSYLQSDSNVKKISTHITKKVADKLEDMFKKDRADFEKKWEDIKVFIEFGMLSEEKFYERAEKFTLFKNIEGKYFTLEEFREKIKDAQTDKDKKTIFLYTTNVDEQHTFIDNAKQRGYDVLLLDTPFSAHLVNKLEQRLKDAEFRRVDADTIEKLIKKEDAMPSKLNDDEKNKVKPVFESIISKERFTVEFESLSESDNPVTITQPEFMRRMKDMSMMGGAPAFGMMPEMHNLVVNGNHPLISKILQEQDAEKQKALAKQATDLALLSQNMLKGQDLTNFIKRSVQLIA